MKDNKLVRFLVNGRSYKTLNEAMEYAKKNDCDRVIKRTIDTDGDSLEENCDTVVWTKKQRCDAYILKESKRLTEGTSNFGSLEYLPLLVFYMWDEVMEMMDNDEDCPQYDDFENEDDYYTALEKYQEDYMDKLGVCILTEEEVDDLEYKLREFNEETKDRFEELTYNEEGGYHDYEHNGDLEDIMVSVEPGYYQGAQLDVDDRLFDYLDEDVKKEQLERFQNFFEELKKNFGLTELEVAWKASNGETGYTVKKNESCEVKESRDVDNLDDAEPEVKWAVIKPYLNVKLEDDETPTGGTSYAGETFFDFINDLGWTDLEIAEMTEEEWNELLKDCGIKPIFPIKEDLPKDQIDKMYDATVKNNGGNFDTKTGEPLKIKNRILVGRKGHNFDSDIKDVDKKTFGDKVNDLQSQAKPGDVLGTWNDENNPNKDEGDKCSSVDLSKRFKNMRQAKKFAKDRGEKAVYKIDRKGKGTQKNLRYKKGELATESLEESKVDYTNKEDLNESPNKYEYKGYKEGLKDIASDVASLWGAQCFRIVPNFEKRIVTLYCIEDGEEFTTEITFDELKDEYDFDIVKEIMNEHNGNLKESKKSLKEGAGSGYTVEGRLDDIKIESVSNVDRNDTYLKVECQGSAILSDCSASSYYCGNEIASGADIPVDITYIEYNDYDGKLDNEYNGDVVAFLNDEFNGNGFDFKSEVIGGGWSHMTFEGAVTAPCTSSYNGCESVDFVITNENVVRAIDNATTGDDWSTEYVCYDESGNELEYFEDKDEAVKYAEQNKEVESITAYDYQYQLMSDLESLDIINYDTKETIWWRDEENKNESLNKGENK